jgi:hypothetical protein
MSAINYEILDTHFAAEIKNYGILSVDTEKGVVQSKRIAPPSIIEGIIKFAKEIEKAETQRGQTVRYERDEKAQQVGDSEIRYITGLDIHGEQTITQVQVLTPNFIKIRPCDILNFRADIARIFELYSISKDEI